MHKVVRTLRFALASSALLVASTIIASNVAPSLVSDALASNAGGKGGEKSSGKGGDNRGGNKSGGKSSSGKSSASGSAAGGQGASKASAAKEIGVAKASTGAQQSELGRWSAVKPMEHPAIQAHIRNGNFKGTIGLNAAYLVAQDTYNKLDPQALAEAKALVEAAESYPAAAAEAEATIAKAVESYNAANAEGEPDLSVDEYKALVAEGKIVPDDATKAAIDFVAAGAPDTTAAQALLDEAADALQALKDAEAAMATASNRGAWEDIRGAVRSKMGLDASEDDIAAAELADGTAAQAGDLY